MRIGILITGLRYCMHVLSFPAIQSIKKRRLMLGKTQNQLAHLCGVSQSIIAKIERGMVDPSYSTASRIFAALEMLEKKSSEKLAPELTAKDVMTRKVVSVRPTDPATKAAQTMLDDNFSQLPVMDGDRVIGSVTEREVMNATIEQAKISDIMVESFPMVSQNTTLSTLRNILMEEPAVLVQEKLRVVGIVTKYDVIAKGDNV